MRIAEVCRRYDISADTLRYYERVGLLRNIRRNASGVRDYSEENCSAVSFVKCMRSAGVSVETLVQYMDLLEQGASTLGARKALLERQRAIISEKIQEMQAGLDKLDYKIAHYEEIIISSEERMRPEKDPCEDGLLE